MDQEQENNSRLRSQIQSLRSGNHVAILSTLKELRSEGNVSVLPDLFDVMLDQENEVILMEISSLLNDLKDQEAAEQLVKAIDNPEFKSIQAPLVAACWQNSLSYGKFLSSFVEVAITGDYAAAIEAFTVIEEAVGEIEDNQKEKAVKTLKSKILNVDEQKQPLLSELIKVIQTY